MSNTFRALRVSADHAVTLEDRPREPLAPGEVRVAVEVSSLNYKDALAVTGRGKILRHFPLTPGIDAAGVVNESRAAEFTVGDAVVITGAGLGETTDGGYAEELRTAAAHVVHRPPDLSARRAMILGTAGFTAALAFERMRHNGQTPALGPILITGASGGVGSLAIQIFARAGFTVHAVSAKRDRANDLRALGAAEVLTPNDLDLGPRPLETVRYGGAVDTVGGETLARLLAHVQLGGNVAAVGLAESARLPATVVPFILRGINLLGVSSTNAPAGLRPGLWKNLAGPWRPPRLDELVSREVDLDSVVATAVDMLERRTHGRILVHPGGI